MRIYRILLLSFLFSCAVIQLFERNSCEFDIPIAIDYGKASDDLRTASYSEKTRNYQSSYQGRFLQNTYSTPNTYIKHGKRRAVNLTLPAAVRLFYDALIISSKPVIRNNSSSIPDGLNSFLIRFLRC